MVIEKIVSWHDEPIDCLEIHHPVETSNRLIIFCLLSLFALAITLSTFLFWLGAWPVALFTWVGPALMAHITFQLRKELKSVTKIGFAKEHVWIEYRRPCCRIYWSSLRGQCHFFTRVHSSGSDRFGMLGDGGVFIFSGLIYSEDLRQLSDLMSRYGLKAYQSEENLRVIFC
ncbi:hypothetical protein [Marinibactrum halimedae]|uniref:DUF2244 domain-containing protein n=1 Tax=Marinibactrum halimedae TaxID=1444977 RepID=A0AA37WLX2_9GAMM|nr:hypothetical protein [Marinibactrum halimedae]MCD9460093.1 hypothetical protein [Marinibactrum halimedae]GLS26494.1 hypothetical protein GCM10007877_22100 [Marinibactrum halimedae]